MDRSTFFLAAFLASTVSVGAAAQGTGSEAAGGNGTGMDTRTDRTTGDRDTGTSTSTDRATTIDGNTGTGSDRAAPSFDDLDANRDGFIDEDEAREGNFSRQFRAIDRDGRNTIDRDQFDQYRGQAGQGRGQEQRSPTR